MRNFYVYELLCYFLSDKSGIKSVISSFTQIDREIKNFDIKRKRKFKAYSDS